MTKKYKIQDTGMSTQLLNNEKKTNIKEFRKELRDHIVVGIELVLACNL